MNILELKCGGEGVLQILKYALTILENGRTIIDNAVNYVLEKKEVTGEELATLFENNGIMPTNN
jgi:hypothetical protein